jgi:hypothetical protein
MLSMIANPVTALPVGYPRSGLSRSDLVLWPWTSPVTMRRFPRYWGISGLVENTWIGALMTLSRLRRDRPAAGGL